MMESESQSADSVLPIPPHYWWFKRIAATVVILLIALGLLRWWWGVKAHRALQAEIDRLVATGQPVFPDDFRPPAVPDDQNAVIPLKQAAAALSLTKAEQQLLGQIRGDVKKYQGSVGEVQEILNHTASSRDLVRESRRRAGADWAWYPRGLSSLPPSMLPYSDLLAMLGAAALDAHSRGNDAEVAEILRDMLACGRCFQSMSILLASLLDYGASAQAATILSACGSELRIQPGSDTRGNGGQPATRRQIEDLMTDLMNEQRSREAFQRAFCAERLLSLDAINMMTGGGYSISQGSAANTWSRFEGFVMKPAFELDGAWLLRHMTMFADAAGAPDCPTASRRLPEPVPAQRVRGLRRTAHRLSDMLAPNLRGVIEHSFDTLARRRMAAVALGIRLWELDHGGLPEHLEQLVPRYLPAVPQDPFVDDGRGVGYRPKANRPILYCVGPPDRSGKRAEIAFPLRAKLPTSAPAHAQTRPISR